MQPAGELDPIAQEVLQESTAEAWRSMENRDPSWCAADVAADIVQRLVAMYELPWQVLVPRTDGLIGKFEVPGYGEVLAYTSKHDAALVIEIDTPEATAENGNADSDTRPKIRVHINDDPVWENPPFPGSSTDPEEG